MNREKEERGLSSLYDLRSNLIQKEIYEGNISFPAPGTTKEKFDIQN
jgi:hypothetical protein